MLSNLLPGLRELRAPFAAGVLWLLAAWVQWEPLLPTPDEAKKTSGLANSFYRLHGLVPDVALGAAAGFIVYLLGSLSVALLSDPLRASFRVSLSSDGQMLNPLTHSTVRGLHRLARRMRTEIEALLAPVGGSVDEFLAVEREAPSMSRRRGDMWNRVLSRIRSSALVDNLCKKWNRAWSYIRSVKLAERLSEKWEGRRRRKQRRSIMRHAAAPAPEAVTERELAELAVLDLDVVTTARLLGKDQELYSAIDRHRAEVEFRLGVIPPLLVLFVAASLRLPNRWSTVVVVLLGVAAAIGLYWDALKQQREANSLLVDAAVHNRVEFPSLERLRANALHVGKMTAHEVALRVESEMTRTVAIAKELDSFASSAEAAAAAFDRTLRYFALFGPRLEPPVLRDRAYLAFHAVEETVAIWNRGVKGELEEGWTKSGRTRLSVAVEYFEQFRNLMRHEGSLPTVKAPEAQKFAGIADLPSG